MKRKGFLRGIMLALAMICACLSSSLMPEAAFAAGDNVNITIIGHEMYDAARLVIEDINSLRKANGLNELILDANLQEGAMKLAAEKAFHNGSETLRPNGESYWSVLPSNYSSATIRIAICPALISMTSENMRDAIRPLYSSELSSYRDIVNDPFVTIGVGVYQPFAGGNLTVCFMLYDVNAYLRDGSPYAKGEYKPTISNAKRTIETNPSYIQISNDAEFYSSVEDKKTYQFRDISLNVGETKALTLLNYYVSQNTAQYCIIDSSLASWRSNNSSVATVDGFGRVTGVKKGNTTITATCGGRTIYYNITVGSNIGEDSQSQKPAVKKLTDLPENFKGLAIVGGKEMYVKNRKKASGNVTVDGVTYYYKNGTKYTGWLTKGKKKYYYQKGCKVKNKIFKIKGKQYYFNKKGIMKTGQIKFNGKYYYFDQSGVMQKNKWIKVKGKKYYFNKKGVRTEKK